MAIGEDLIRRTVTEAIGTFILVFAGIAAALSSGNYVFGFGFALIVIVYALGNLSGAHVNPAVTLGLAITGRFPMTEVPYYWIGQAVGAGTAAVLLRLLFGGDTSLGVTQVSADFSAVDGFVFELIATGLLVFVIMAVATNKRADAAISGLAIGGTLLLIQVFAGEVTGASVNPIRSLAPAIVAGEFGDLWIYLTAPFIGGILGAVLYEFIRGDGDRPAGSAISVSDLVGKVKPPARPAGEGRQRQPRSQGGPGGQRQRRPQQPPQRTQEPEYEEDFGPVDAYDEDLPPVRPQQQQRAPRQGQGQAFDPNQPQRPPQQVRRRPQQ